MDLVSLKDLPDRTLIDIALGLNLEDVLNLCQLDSTLNQKLCQNELFWETLVRRDSPNLNYLPVGSRSNTYWKDLYSEMHQDGIFKLTNDGFELVARGYQISHFTIFYATNDVGYPVFSSGPNLYIVRNNQNILIFSFESAIKELYYEGINTASVLLENGKYYSVKENDQGAWTSTLIQENVELLAGDDDYLDKDGIYHYKRQAPTVGTLGGGVYYEQATMDLSFIPNISEIIEGRIFLWILDNSGNLHYIKRTEPTRHGIIETNVTKLFRIQDLPIALDAEGNVHELNHWYNVIQDDPLIREMNHFRGKRIKNIDHLYYSNFSEEIYRINPGGDELIPKSEEMGSIKRLLGNLYVLASIIPQNIVQSDYNEISRLIQSPDFASYKLGKKVGVNQEITVELRDGSQYRALIYRQNNQIYSPIVEVDFEQIKQLLYSPNMKTYYFERKEGNNADLFVELNNGTRYKALVFLVANQIYPPVV